MAWTYVGVSSAASSASGNITLTEPSGVQEGDLCVAIISYRSNAAFTNPGGVWSDITERNAGNTTANTTGSIASGKIAFYVRGASAPSLTFTRTGGDIALGRIVAYRGQKASSPLVTATGVTLAAASTSIVCTGMTTTSARDLLVVGACGARNSSFTNFDAATDPTTTSGTASNETGNPSEGDWQERADSGTTTGADCSLGIADALRATAGATGNLTITASSSARHVVVAAAFAEQVVHALDGADVSSGTPTVSAGTITQTHVIDGSDAASGTPTTTNATLGQVHVLAGTGATSGQPTVTNGTVGISHILDGADVTSGTPDVTSGTLGQTHVITGASIASGTPTVSNATLGQTHVLDGASVATAAPTVTSGTITQTHVLDGADIATATPTVTNATLGQEHALTGASVSSGQPTVTAGSLGQVHVLDGADIASGQPAATNGTLTEGSTTDALTGQSVASGTPTITNGTLGVVQDSIPVGNASGGRAAGGPSSRRKRKLKDDLDRARQEGRLLKLTDLTGGGGGLDLDALDLDDELGQQSQPKRRKGKQQDGDETNPALVPHPLPPSLDATLVQVQRLIADATDKVKQEQLALLAEEQDEEDVLELLLLSM